MRRCHSSPLSLQYHLWLYGVLRVICADCRPCNHILRDLDSIDTGIRELTDGMIIRLVQTLDPTSPNAPRKIGQLLRTEFSK
ncbi:hypothetical protein BJV77DRAFT_465929 [Russula vinacea]|nr:hypothetical protein BJV77DRAFT_465929 [Russula vinacea]